VGGRTVMTEDKLPAGDKARNDMLKEEAKAINKSLYDPEATLDKERKSEMKARLKEIDEEIAGRRKVAEPGKGRAVNPDLQKSYNDLRKQGKSPEEALRIIEQQTPKEAEEPEKATAITEEIKVSKGEQRTPQGKGIVGATFNEAWSKLTPEQQKKAKQAEKAGYQLSVKNGKIHVNVAGKLTPIGQ